MSKLRLMHNPPKESKKLSIRHHLIGLVLMTVIPVVLFAAVLVTYLAQQRTQFLEQNLVGTTRALNSAIDEQIISVVSSLKILSEVEEFHPGKIQYLHKRLQRFVGNQKDWAYLAFVDTSGTQIFKTSERFGSKLPNLKNQPFFGQMLRTGESVISGYRSDENVITVSVPVKINGTIVYALIASLEIQSFSRLLNSQNLPDNWVAAILDNEANILAHTRNSSYFVGRKASPKLSEKILWEDSQVFNDTNSEGKRAFGATSHSNVSDWTIILRVPDDGHIFTYWKSISFILLGGGIFLCSSIFFALYMGRKIAHPIHALSQSAKALGQGSLLVGAESSLQEIHDVNQALKLAGLQLRSNEEKINSLYEKAQEAIKIRDTFLSVASHELKTPITTLKLQFQMLDRLAKKHDFIPKKDLEKPLIRVHDQTRRLMMLIDDFLDVSRISAGKMEYRPETFDLVPFVLDVVQQLQDEASKVGSPIDMKGIETLTGHWDRHRLEQVMVNLITNAIKYGNSKPITISIELIGGSAVILVKDHGIGISAENLTRVFERYERAVEGRDISGLGLGLWIVNKILHGFEGSISVTSQLGEGSVFKVSIPLQKQFSDSTEKLV